MDIDAAMQQNTADRQQELGQLAPDAGEPLDSTSLQVLHDTMNEAAVELTNGQVSPLPPPAMDGELTMVPAPTASGIMALQGMAQMVPEGAPYTGLVEMLGSNDGIVEATMLIDQMAKDKALSRALQNAAPEEEAEDSATEPADPQSTPMSDEDKLTKLL